MNTAGCTTSWVNYANEPSQAALELSRQDAYDVIWSGRVTGSTTPGSGHVRSHVRRSELVPTVPTLTTVIELDGVHRAADEYVFQSALKCVQ